MPCKVTGAIRRQTDSRWVKTVSQDADGLNNSLELDNSKKCLTENLEYIIALKLFAHWNETETEALQIGFVSVSFQFTNSLNALAASWPVHMVEWRVVLSVRESSSYQIDWLIDWLIGVERHFQHKWAISCLWKVCCSFKKVKLMRKLMLRVGNTYNKPLQ